MRMKSGLFALVLSAGLCLAAGCATPPQPAQIVFPVIGDTPYGPEDEAQLRDEIVPAIRAARHPFVIHIGDYKAGATPCTEEYDAAFDALIEALAPAQVFYTPGDNEWTDCDRNLDPSTGSPMSELGRLEQLRARHFRPASVDKNRWAYESQDAQAENATWRHAGIRFATLHVVGTNNGRNFVTGDPLDAAAAAADARDANNLAWIAYVAQAARRERARALVIAMHGAFTDTPERVRDIACDGLAGTGRTPCDGFAALRPALRAGAETFGGPTLLIHGDTAPFTLDQDMLGFEAPNLWRLNAAGDAGTNNGVPYGVRDATLVTVAPEQHPPFAATGLVTGAAPETGR
jgi:hypothetical protein